MYIDRYVVYAYVLCLRVSAFVRMCNMHTCMFDTMSYESAQLLKLKLVRARLAWVQLSVPLPHLPQHEKQSPFIRAFAKHLSAVARYLGTRVKACPSHV